MSDIRHLTKEGRAEWVAKLRAKGMSTRAIADAVGVSQSCVIKDMKAGEHLFSPAPEPEPDPEPESPDPTPSPLAAPALRGGEVRHVTHLHLLWRMRPSPFQASCMSWMR